MEMNRFRTQLGGFHRGDVAEYIEKSAREHQQRLQQVKDDCTKIAAERDALREELNAVKAQLEAALDGKALPEAPVENPEAMELEAYRRAEAAERKAMVRAKKQTEKMDAVLDGVTTDFAQAQTKIKALAQSMQDSADKLQDVLQELEGGMESAAGEMQALKEENEE